MDEEGAFAQGRKFATYWPQTAFGNVFTTKKLSRFPITHIYENEHPFFVRPL